MVQLKNGATQILEVLTPHHCSFVLAVTESAFVTWRKDNECNCFSGNYYILSTLGLLEAIADFEARSGG